MDSSRIVAIPLFSALGPEQQAKLAEVAGEVVLPACAVIAAEGDVATRSARSRTGPPRSGATTS